MSKDTIKFPCVVNIKGFTEDLVINLTNAFVELGVTVYEDTDTNNHTAWKYYGVNSRNKTAFWDYLSDYYDYEDEYKVTEYTYDEVMAFGNNTEEEEVTVFTPSIGQPEPQYKAGDIVEITESLYGHDFEIGDHVRLVHTSDNLTWRAEYLDGSDYWHIDADEFKLVTPAGDAAEASSNDDTATLEPIEYEGSGSGETVSNQSVGASVTTKQVFSLGDEVEVVEGSRWVGAGMKGVIEKINAHDIEKDREPYRINFDGKKIWVNGYQLKLVNSAVGLVVPEEVCATAINITANVSFTVKIKGQEFTLDKDEIQELYIALCLAEGSLQEWSLGQ